MELFEINYFDRAMNIFSESFKFRKYRLMAKPFAILTAVVLLPFQLASLLVGAIMLLLALILRIDFSLINGWHKIVTDEGQKTRHATQVVIYFFSWPFVLFAYVCAGMLLVFMSILYLIYACVAYIWTLGGIKFKAFIGDSEDCRVYTTKKYNLPIPLVFTIITAAFLVVAPLIAAIVIVVDLSAYDAMEFFWMDFSTALMACVGGEVGFAALYSFFAYAKYPKEDNKQIEE